MKRFEVTETLTRIVAEAGCVLRPVKYDDPYSDIVDVTVSNPDDWEEVPRDSLPPYRKAEYKAKIVALIRRRYDQDDEAAIVANALVDNPSEEHRAEFAAYQSYRRECKAAAVSALTERTSNNRSGT